MTAPARSVNAWLLVGEDDPPGTTCFSPESSYQIPFSVTAPAGQAMVALNGTTAAVPEAAGGTSPVIASLGAVFADTGESVAASDS
jgi:hypothetical protein